ILDRVDLRPANLLRSWTPMPPDRGRTLLIVELQRSLEPASSGRLTLQLRPAKTWPITSQANSATVAELSLPFPEIVPQGTRFWDGILAVEINPLYEAVVRASSPAVASDQGIEAQEEATSAVRGSARSLLNSRPAPWGAQVADHVYAFRGEAVNGTVTLRRRPSRVRAHATGEIILAAGRAAVLTRLLLQPVMGNPSTIDLLVSAPVSGTWNWRCEGNRNAVTRME